MSFACKDKHWLMFVRSIYYACLLIIMFVYGVILTMAEPAEDVPQVFEMVLVDRNIKFEKLGDGRYKIFLDKGESTVSLDNLIRRFNRDRDIRVVERFLSTILLVKELPPNWNEAKHKVFPILEGKDLEISDDVLTKSLSDKVYRLAIFYDEEDGFLTFLNKGTLEKWNLTEEEIWSVAKTNLDNAMENTRVSYLDAGDLRLGVIEAQEPLKASLILSPFLKKEIEKELGWPVYAVAPSRGFVYLLKDSDGDQLSRVGGVVVKEFLSAEYPISTEVWKITDDGIEAIGEFPVE